MAKKRYKKPDVKAKPLPHKTKWKKDPWTGKMVKDVPKPQPMKKVEDGGEMKGPSHENGGIPIEVEGGEYIIKKDSVNASTEPILEEINKTGKLLYKYGGKIPHHDARNRSKRRK